MINKYDSDFVFGSDFLENDLTNNFGSIVKNGSFLKDLKLDYCLIQLSSLDLSKFRNKTLDLSNIHKKIDLCIKDGIKPIILFNNSDLPIELIEIGGWENREIVDFFINFISFYIDEFSQKVNDWIILSNHQKITRVNAFLSDIKAKINVNYHLSSLHNINLIQTLGYNLIKKKQIHSNVGVLISYTNLYPLTYSEKDIEATNRVNYLLNAMFIEPLFGIDYEKSKLPLLKGMNKFNPKNYGINLNNYDFILFEKLPSKYVQFSVYTPYINAKLTDKKNKITNQNYNVELYEVIKKINDYKLFDKIYFLDATIPKFENQIDYRNTIKQIDLNINSIFYAKENQTEVSGLFLLNKFI